MNALLGRRIAKVSATPGKTRLLNVFLVGRGMPCPYYLLDLPGYGYARAGKTDRAAFRRLLAQALERARVAGVIWLLDIRHPPSADDRAMQDVLAEGGTGVLAALTKCDKLPRGQRRRREQELRAALTLDEDQAIVTSARTGEGIQELQEAIEALVREATE